MLLSRTAFAAFFLLVAFAIPFAAYADAPTLTTYSVTPSTIYVNVPVGSPLATTTTISLGFSEKVKVSLRVLDASGANIKTIYTSSGVTNPDAKHWDGTNTSGAVVPFGVYTIQVVATSTATGAAVVDTSKTITVAAPGVAAPPSPSTPFSISLVPNWNLISLPVTPSNASPASVFGTAAGAIDSVWTYAPTNPAADPSGWLVYDPTHPEVSNLSAITSGYGYFVHAHAPANFSGSGSLFPIGSTPPERSLAKGWNLVGAFMTTPQHIDDAFASIGFSGLEYTALWKLNASSQTFETPTMVDPQTGFWIFLDAPHAYVPANL